MRYELAESTRLMSAVSTAHLHVGRAGGSRPIRRSTAGPNRWKQQLHLDFSKFAVQIVRERVPKPGCKLTWRCESSQSSQTIPPSCRWALGTLKEGLQDIGKAPQPCSAIGPHTISQNLIEPCTTLTRGYCCFDRHGCCTSLRRDACQNLSGPSSLCKLEGCWSSLASLFIRVSNTSIPSSPQVWEDSFSQHSSTLCRLRSW